MIIAPHRYLRHRRTGARNFVRRRNGYAISDILSFASSFTLREAGDMTGISTERVQWLMRHVVPQEPALRARIRRWALPDGLASEDLIQEVYSRFVTMESVAQIRNPKSYLFAVARSIMLMH